MNLNVDYAITQSTLYSTICTRIDRPRAYLKRALNRRQIIIKLMSTTATGQNGSSLSAPSSSSGLSCKLQDENPTTTAIRIYMERHRPGLLQAYTYKYFSGIVIFNTSSPSAGRSKLQSIMMCMSVRFVCSLAKLENHTAKLYPVLCMLPCSGLWLGPIGHPLVGLRLAIRYVLPVLWKTSCFHTMGPVGQIFKHDGMFRRSSPGGGTSWTSNDQAYGVWSSSTECGIRGEVCNL